MTATSDGKAFDVVVIGGGTAGMTAAKLVARAGKSVALIEAERTGGDCLYTGCVPSKSLLATARVLQTIRQAGDYGVAVGEPTLDLAAAVSRKERIIDRIGEADSPAALERAGVRVIHGAARFSASHTVVVAGRDIHGDRFVIATGSRPTVPPIEGLAEVGYVTNVELMDARATPRRLAVIGGGTTGLELGQAFSRFGSDATVVERSARLLERDDDEVVGLVQRCLQREGMAIRLGREVVHVERHADAKRLTLHAHDGGEETLDADEILVATGRTPNVEELDLATAGVEVGEQGIRVDERLRTSASHIWACGDVTGPPYLTHAAEDQARAVSKNVLGGRSRWSGRAIPWATFTDPEIAGVGLTEEQARGESGDRLEVLRLPLSAVDRAVTDGQSDGLIKVLLAPGWMRGFAGGEVVGAHAAGERATEIVQQFALLMAWRLPLGMLAKTVQAYPTFGLGARQVAGLHWMRTRGMSAEPSLVERLLAKLA